MSNDRTPPWQWRRADLFRPDRDQA